MKPQKTYIALGAITKDVKEEYFMCSNNEGFLVFMKVSDNLFIKPSFEIVSHEFHYIEAIIPEMTLKNAKAILEQIHYGSEIEIIERVLKSS